MLLTELFEDFKTKGGQEITFKRITDAEKNENRGWQVDKLEAYVGDKKAGYLKLAYIPHLRFHQHYPSIFNYADHFGSLQALPYEKRDKHYKEFTSEEQRKMLKDLLHSRVYRGHEYGSEEKIVNDYTDRQVLAELKKIEQMLSDGKMGVELRKFKNFHKDKPLVDYIKVYDEFQRQRIGEALYREGAKWMKEKGMKVYASGLQSDKAKASWEHMKKSLGNVRKARRNRRTLDAID